MESKESKNRFAIRTYTREEGPEVTNKNFSVLSVPAAKYFYHTILKRGRVLMKKTSMAVLAVIFVLCSGAMAFAKSAGTSSAPSQPGEFEVDGSFAPATGPGDYNGGFGVNFGIGYSLGEIDKHLQARFDLSFYQFKNDFSWGSGSYTRVPFTISARYSVPVVDKLSVFGQAGLETSIDDFDNAAHQKKSEVNLGISPGAGVEFFVNRKISVFALGRAHLISDSYFSMQFGVASYF